MWAVVKPVTKTEKLGTKHVATSTMLWEDRSPDSQWPKITAISNILKKGMPDMPTMMRKAISTIISQISDEAQLVAKKWCMGALTTSSNMRILGSPRSEIRIRIALELKKLIGQSGVSQSKHIYS